MMIFTHNDDSINTHNTPSKKTMPPYGAEPDWATPGDTSTPVTPAPASASQADASATPANEPSGGGGGNTRCILVLLSCLSIGIATMMAALGVLTILEFAESNVSLKDVTSKPFLAAYMIIFAALLFFYELMWWLPIPAINRTLRKNFGFMYGLKGKGFYMIFVAFLCIGLKNEGNDIIKGLNWATGIAFLFSGALHFFLICTNPEFLATYKAPTAGLDRWGSSTNEGQGENVV